MTKNSLKRPQIIILTCFFFQRKPRVQSLQKNNFRCARARLRAHIFILNMKVLFFYLLKSYNSNAGNEDRNIDELLRKLSESTLERVLSLGKKSKSKQWKLAKLIKDEGECCFATFFVFKSSSVSFWWVLCFETDIASDSSTGCGRGQAAVHELSLQGMTIFCSTHSHFKFPHFWITILLIALEFQVCNCFFLKKFSLLIYMSKFSQAASA